MNPRLLILGMQSSGASTLALLLAQQPGCAAFVDVWAQYVAPELPRDGAAAMAKVVMTTAFPLSLHKERFRPDLTILFLRHPTANHRSLVSKSYRHHCGFMEEKFALADAHFLEADRFDAVMHYEDLVCDPVGTLATIDALGWRCDASFLTFPRKPKEIKQTNGLLYPSIVDRLEYGIGTHHPGNVTPRFLNLREPLDASPVAAWCPMLLEYYTMKLEERKEVWKLAPTEGGIR